MTRALALYEKAELQHENQFYFEAINLLGSALQSSPDDPIALFNRAIICEKVNAYQCAKSDWDHFLKIETDANWIAEAQEHLKLLEQKKKLVN
jgi:tetratricopeptide (TPR) repeat protein